MIIIDRYPLLWSPTEQLDVHYLNGLALIWFEKCVCVGVCVCGGVGKFTQNVVENNVRIHQMWEAGPMSP